jgi:two-component system sensor histidine kinase KdpD
VPEAFLRLADDIEVVDVPAGYVRTPSDGEASADVVRQQRVLSELREMALLLAAEVVDYQLEAYLRRHGIAHVASTHERILVCVSPRSSAAVMVRRGRRQADRFHGELHVVHLEENLPPEGRATVEQNLAIARDAGARVTVLHGRDLVTAVLRYAREHGITQIFVGHARRTRGPLRVRRNLVERLIRDADGFDVRVFPRD